MSDDKMQTEFEAWAEDYNLGITLAAASATGLYTRNIAWTAWQAAYAAGQKSEREAIFIEWENGETLAKEVERLRDQLAAAKAASVWPVGWTEIRTNPGGNVVIYTENHEIAFQLMAWLRDRMKDTTPPQA